MPQMPYDSNRLANRNFGLSLKSVCRSAAIEISSGGKLAHSDLILSSADHYNVR